MAQLAGTSVSRGEAASPASLTLDGDSDDTAIWPLAQALATASRHETLTDLAERLQGRVPPGPWSDPPHTAVVEPIQSNKAHSLAGFLVAGIRIDCNWTIIIRTS